LAAGGAVPMPVSTKFLREHIFEIVLSTLVSLATVVGGYLLTSIKTNVDNLQCRISQFAAKNEFEAVQLKLIVTPLDDVNRSSSAFGGLSRIVQGYQDTLGKCDQGRDTLAQIEAYRHGLEAFIDRDWDGAISNFKKITDRTALTEKSIANAFLHKYLELKKRRDPRAGDIEQQWKARLSAAEDLAAKESASSVKERAVYYLKCNGMLVSVPARDAIKCLKGLVNKNLDSYIVHYNLAALYARSGDFATAMREMQICMQMPGASNQRRSDIENDEDFKILLQDSTYGPQFEHLIINLHL
jgi:hypothetical protein